MLHFMNSKPDATMAQRPLSPHLSIWKWGPHMAVSILHRITGDGMALVGLGVLLWWLGAMASGAASYARFQEIMGSPIGMVVLVGLSWAFFTHMTSGLRHFVLDMGAGYELTTNKTWSLAVPFIGIILTVLFWAVVLTK
jgi:succinate dehydrogenase / fumarate reductase cytochrome b subunit